MKRDFNLFVYGTLLRDGAAAGLLEEATLLRTAQVGGSLYQTDAGYPVLVLGGSERVPGEIWRCPVPLLARLDQYEGVDEGLFRRVALYVEDVPCWTYVGGPSLSRQLTPERRVRATPTPR